MKRLFVAMGATLLLAGLPTLSVQAANKWWKGGAGTLDNTTANFFATDATGGTAVTAGTGDTVRFSAGTTFTSSYSMAGTVTYAGLVVEEGTITLANVVTTATSPITVSGGTLVISVSTSLATSSGSVLTLSNGARFRNSNTSTTGSFIDTDSTITLGAGGGTISGTGGAAAQTIIQPTTIISGTGPLVKDGNAIIAVAAPCNYTGATIVNDGTLRCRTTANVFPTGTDLTVTSPGVFSLNGINQQVASVTGNGTVTLGSGTLTIGGSTSPAVFSGAITSSTSGDVTKVGTGTLTLGGPNDFDGTLTLVLGTITVNSGASLCNSVCDVVVNGGTLNLNNTAQTIENLTGTNGTINLGAGHTLTSTAIASGAYSGTIAGAGNFTKTDSFNQTLSGANTYTGITTISGVGTISVGSATALGSTAGKTVVASGAGLNFSAGTVLTVNEPIDIAGTGNTVATGGAISVATASTAITFGGTITLTADAAVGVSSGAGTSGIFSGSPAFTGANKNLTLNGASGTGTKTISGNVVLGTGSLTKAQTGTWNLTASNSYSGGTTISTGTLDGQVANSFGSGNVSVSAGAILKQESSSALNASASLALAGTTSTANLNFVGTQTINALSINGVTKAAGVWGAVGSGAAHTSSQIIGTGLLNVTTGPATSAALSSSLNPSTFDALVTFTATVTGASPSGTVTFLDGAAILGTGTLSSGVATFATSALDVAGSPHSITAVYTGDNNNNGSISSAVSQVVNMAPQTITFGTVADKSYGASFSPGASASSGLAIAYSVVSGPAGIAGNIVTVTNLGSVTIRASQPGNGNYNPASDVDQSFTVNPAAITVTADSLSRSYGETNPVLTVTYTGFQLSETLGTSDIAGAPDLGTLAETNSPVGTYGITNATGSLTSTHYTFVLVDSTLTVTNAFSTNVVSVSANPVATGSSVTLTATLSALAPSPAIAEGTVQFVLDGSPFGAPVTLTNGVASTNATIGHGSFTLVARYAGDTNLIGSTNSLSQPLLVNKLPVAGDDSILRPDNGGTKVSKASLLTNDTDDDSDALAITSVSGASAQGGTVTTDTTHVYYTAPAGNPATDTFTYTVGDGFGTPVTATVTVTIAPPDNGQPPNITGLITLADGNKQINFAGIPGRSYLIQGTASLTPPVSWTTLNTNTAGTNGLFEYIDLDGTNFATRYYRSAKP